MNTIVIGIGNPFLADDRVGLEVVRRLAARAGEEAGAAFVELHAGGFRLMETMAGYGRAVLVDAVESGAAAPGTVYRLGIGDLSRTRNCCCSHDASLAVALELGVCAGLPLPLDVSGWGIETGDVTTFGGRLTPAVEDAAESVVNRILAELNL